MNIIKKYSEEKLKIFYTNMFDGKTYTLETEYYIDTIPH